MEMLIKDFHILGSQHAQQGQTINQKKIRFATRFRYG